LKGLIGRQAGKPGSSKMERWQKGPFLCIAGFSNPVLLWGLSETNFFNPQAINCSAKQYILLKGISYLKQY